MSESAEPGLDLTQTPCAACGEISTSNEGMVGCDGCESWYHNRCVGIVDETKLDKRWFCTAESCKALALKYRKEKEIKRGKGSGKKNPEIAKSVEQQLKEMEENRKRLEQEMEAEAVLKRNEREIKRALEQKRLLLEQQLREEEEEEEYARQERVLMEKRMQVRRMKERHEELRNEMASLDEEMQKLDAAGKKVESLSSVVPIPSSSGNPLKIPKAFGKQQSTEQNENDEEDASSEDESSSEEEKDENGEDAEEEKPEKIKPKDKTDQTNRNRQGQQRSGPTKAQLAVRSGVTKKLPTFSGKPEEWPLFYSSFQASNEACGFSDVENLVRLQECLKGPALEMVRGQLLLPKSVPKVVEKLRILYGRPEQLLQCHLEKVRKLESPKAGKLASFVPFGTAVEQLCEHLEAAELKQHLVNPLLIQDLVDKLPDNDKREWVRYKRGKKRVTLRTFTNFISEIVAEACEANVCLDYKPLSKPVAEVQLGKGKVKEKGAVYNHGEYTSGAGNEERKKQKPCRVCERTDHRLRYCEDSKKLPYVDRKRIVDRFKLCQVCLNDHGTAQCKFKLRCNVGECREAHNPLLHPVQGVVSAHIRADNVTFFRMIPVNLHCGERTVTVLAFLDEGASVTLVEKSLVDRLGAVGVAEKLTIKWTADIARVEKESRRLNLWVSALDADEKLLLKTVRTVGKLMLPQQKLDAEELLDQYAYMRGLPIPSYNGRPEILIGLNNIHTFAPIEANIGSVADPIAVRCKLGWTVYGPRQTNTAEASGAYLGVHQDVSNETLYDLLKSHYALEESVVSVPRESVEDGRARKILELTTKQIGDRFETGLLWNTDDPTFPDSYPMALKRMKQLEKRLLKDLKLRQNVHRQIEEYLEKGYAHVATAEELANTETGKVWYLPLNVVRNPKKT
ncbi:uncharacterized protein LOC129716568 [Wyeomyia smithii]|uniref:uncharacterized protein LOC129716568 n=1 Tax=Wyeomyia smithii TaxID=174621 RepID=UPI002467FCF3|nr:uncharacterized protein LOC129716568 [Wyeomyia smithii]